MKSWVTLKKLIQTPWLMLKSRDNTLLWLKSTIQTVWLIPKKKFKMKKLPNVSFKLMTRFHHKEFELKLTKEFTTKFTMMKMKSLWKFMERNSIKSNMNSLSKEIMIKELNSWKNSKKLERNPNIMITFKKSNKPIQLTSTQTVQNINIQVKVKKLKLQMIYPNISFPWLVLLEL